MMRRWLLLWLCAACWFVALPASAQPAITRPVADYADVMDPQSIAVVEHALRLHHDKTGNQIAFLLIRWLDGQPIEDYALRTAVKWGGGSKELDNGVLVVIAVDDRRSRMEVGYGLEATITDSAAKAMLDGLRPELQAGDYAAAVAKLANGLVAKTGGEPSIVLPANRPIKRLPPPAEPNELYTPSSTDSDGFAWLFGVVGLIIVVCWIGAATVGKGGSTFSSPGSSGSWSSSSSSPSSLFGSSSSSGWGSSSGSRSSSSSSSSGSSYSGGGGGFGGGGASSSW